MTDFNVELRSNNIKLILFDRNLSDNVCARFFSRYRTDVLSLYKMEMIPIMKRNLEIAKENEPENISCRICYDGMYLFYQR